MSAAPLHPYPDNAEAIVFWYKNYKGEQGYRCAVPISMRYGTSDYHHSPQWLMLAFDTEKQAEREFAMSDMSHNCLGGEIKLSLTAPAQCSPGCGKVRAALVDIVKMDDDAAAAHGKSNANLNGYGLVDLFDCVGHPFGAGEHKQQPYRSNQLEAALSDARAALAQAPTDTSDAQFETMRRALEDMANLPPALLPSQLVDRFIEVRVKARAALPIPAPLRLPVEDLKVYRDPTRAQATAPPKCSCGKPDNVSCYNPDCARPA